MQSLFLGKYPFLLTRLTVAFNLYSWETAKKTESIRSNTIQEMNEIREEIGMCVSYSIAKLSQVGQHSAVVKIYF